MFLRLVCFFILLFQLAFSLEQNKIKELSVVLTYPLFELNDDEVNTILVNFVNENPEVQYAILKDKIVNEDYSVVYKDKNDFLHMQKDRKNITKIKCQQQIQTIRLKEDEIGELIVCSKKIDKTILFTAEELAWIKENKTISVHNEMDWAPFNFNKNGQPMGFSIDYIKLLAKKSGLEVAFETGTWNDLLNKTFEGKLDVMMNIARTSEREEKISYVGVFARNVTSILTKSNREDITNIESLFGKKVSVVKGFIYEKFLEQRYPKIEVVKYNDSLSALKAVVYDEVDATLGKTAILSYMISENVLKDLKFTSDVKADDPEMENLYIAVRKSAPLLQSILKKAMNEVTIEELDALKLKWFKEKKRINFSKSEYEWLNKRPVIRYSEVNWKPLSIIEQNRMTGIIGDYLSLVADVTGIEFEFIPSKSWNEVLEKFKNGEIDLVPGIGDSEEEVQMGLITQKFASYPMVVITNDEIEYVNSLEDVKNKIFSLPRYYTSYNYIKEKYPNARIMETKNVPEALLNVSNKKADVFLGHIAPALYNISKMGKENLKIAGNAEKSFNHHFLIQSSLPQFHSIVNKVFETITEKERERIYSGWVNVKVEQNTGFSLVVIMKYVVPIILIIFVILSLIVYWNRKLKLLVEKKTADIKQQKEQLQVLLDSFDRNVIFVQTDLKGVIVHPSQSFCETTGYSLNELVGKSTNILRHPDTPKETFKELWSSLLSRKPWSGELKNLKKDGTEYWVYSKIEPDYNNLGEAIGYKSISQDITNKKMVEDLSKNLEKKVEERTADLEEAKAKLEEMHKNTKDSIEYASLIQHALIPENELFKKYFSQYFTIWQPKDIVGGDVYLFEELDDDSCLLMVIDCTGHGVPGAFVTMLVKAIERQIISNIINRNEKASPAKILQIFNRSMKHLLKQESENSISNAGFDGGVLYYNKKENIIRYAGANIPLFYIENGKLKIIKGDRHSIGYKKSDRDFEFTEHTISTQLGMQFYMTTDGYLDQNGGEKGFPFGKRQFSKMIEENHHFSCADQQEVFLYTMMDYQGNEERNDDIAVVGIQI